MTMRVNGPNGIVVNFPDGTDAQTVDKVMREAMGKTVQAQPIGDGTGGFDEFKKNFQAGAYNPYNTTMGDIAHSLQTGVGEGAVGLASFPAQMGQALGSAAAGGIDRLRGIPPDQIQQNQARTQAVMDNSLTNPTNLQKNIEANFGPDYQPRTPLGRGAREIGRFAPSVLIGGPVGMEAKIASVIGGGAGSEIAGTYAPEPYKKYARLAGALAGGAAGSALTDFAAYAPQIAGQTRGSESILRRSLPENFDEYNKLGPDAMVLDASPSMTGVAQGVALQPGQSKNAMFEALTSRDTGRPDRLVNAAEDAMGPYQAPSLVEQQLRQQAHDQAGPYYNQAIENAPALPHNMADLAAHGLTDPTKGLSLDSRSSMLGYMNKIDDALAAETPQEVATRLHDLRQTLDAQIVHDPRDFSQLSSADKASQGVLSQVHQYVDDILKNRIGFDTPDAIYHGKMNDIRDLNYGYDALGGRTGGRPIPPEQYAQDIQGKNPEMLQTGMNADIRDTMGERSNDFSALKSKVGGDNSYNRAKIEQTFGPTTAEKLNNAVNAEGTFSRNSADIMRNSQTGSRLSSEKMVNIPEAPIVPTNATLAGTGLNLLGRLYKSTVNKILIGGSQSTRDALVKALTEKGPQGLVLMQELATGTPDTKMRLLQALIGGTASAQTAGNSANP